MAYHVSSKASTPSEIEKGLNKISPSNASDFTSCAACGKPATMACSACIEDALDETTENAKTYYCNTSCQKAHRREHRTECQRLQSRRALFRAAEIARDAFFIQREKLFDMNIVGIDSKDDSLLLLTAPSEVFQLFLPFPSSLLKDTTDKHAVLAFLECTTWLVHYSKLLQNMIRGLVKPNSAIEMDASLTRVPRATATYCEMTNGGAGRCTQQGYIHQFIKVTLRRGDEYAVDLSGAQYGLHRAAIGWEEYKRKVKPIIRKISAFGFQANEGCPRAALLDAFTQVRERVYIESEFLVAEHVNDSIASWELVNGHVANIVKLPKKEFTSLRSSLLEAVRHGVSNGFAKLHAVDGPLEMLSDGVSLIREIKPSTKIIGHGWDPDTGKEYFDVEQSVRINDLN